MITVDIAVAPFPVTNDCYTRIIVDGHPDWFSSKENRFYSYVIKKPIRTWISPYRKRIFVWPGFLPAFVKEANEASYFFRFSGLREDFDLFKEEINFQAAHLLEERVRINVNSDVILNLDRMADELQVILSGIIDNSIISRRNRRLAQCIKQRLKKKELEFELNEKKIAPGLLLCTDHPILSVSASVIL